MELIVTDDFEGRRPEAEDNHYGTGVCTLTPNRKRKEWGQDKHRGGNCSRRMSITIASRTGKKNWGKVENAGDANPKREGKERTRRGLKEFSTAQQT